MVIATGARYRRLPLARWHDFEGAGIFYSATEIEAEYSRSEPVVVVGGANSSGQAALFLASRGSPVNLVIRHDKLDAGMSDYLARRIREHPRIDTHLGTEVTALHGRDHLTSVDLTHRSDGTVKQRRCVGLFCFIGATPATDWLDGISLDDRGFVLTDTELTDQDLPPVWAALGRRPLPLETSIPGVFAVGDVRHGSTKRVAAAVGEGSSAIPSIHRAITTRSETDPAGPASSVTN